MQYKVIGSDGNEYGPVDVDTLRQWVAEGRIGQSTQMKDADTGRAFLAGSLTWLFPVANLYPQQNTNFTQPNQSKKSHYGDESPFVLSGIVIRSVLAVILFFALHGLGVIVGGYAVYYAYQLNEDGSKYGKVGLAIAGTALLAICIGWALRLNGVDPGIAPS